mgnify:CR=1 FL=1
MCSSDLETIFGMARQAGNGPNPARQVGIGVGIPDTAPAYTVNQACASGLQALALGAAAIRGGQRIGLPGGMGGMSRGPAFLGRARTRRRSRAISCPMRCLMQVKARRRFLPHVRRASGQ